MDAIDATDVALLSLLRGHPSRGLVMCRTVCDDAGKISDFVVQRSNPAAVELLGHGLAPGRRLRGLAGGAGTALVGQLADLVLRGGFATLAVPDVLWADSRRGVRVGVEAGAVGDRVCLLLDDASGPDVRERWFQTLVESSPDVIQVIDRSGMTRYVTPAAAGVLGFAPEALVGHHYAAMVDERDRVLVEDAFARALTALPGAVVDGEFRIRHDSGETRWIHGRALNHLDTPGLDGVVVTSHDVTVPRETRSQLEYAATHDVLTGLANRALFVDHLDLALAGAARRTEGAVAVLFCDLDQFKGINDRLGHGAGDDLLRQVAHLLREVVRPGDTVARFGGDEFAVLCDNLSGSYHAAGLAERALRSIAVAYRLGSTAEEVFVGASIGVAVAEGDAMTAEEMLREADTALYEAKRRGRGRVELFSETLRTTVTTRTRLESDLRRALDRDEFLLSYQPKLDLHQQRIFSAEALLRWQHPDRGLLLPVDFLDLAEETGLIVDIGHWVIRTAVGQVAAWAREGLDVGVQINCSARELAHPGLLPALDDATTDAGVAPSRVELEITECAAVADLDATIDTVVALRGRGMHVALDRFGTGHSSLTWLQRIPVDGIKLDQSFTREMDERAADVVAAIVHLGRALRRLTIAQGVESAEQLRRIAELGCDGAQGYHIAPPMAASEFSSLSTVERC